MHPQISLGRCLLHKLPNVSRSSDGYDAWAASESELIGVSLSASAGVEGEEEPS